MYLDRSDIAVRKDFEGVAKQDWVTLFRPGNRVYPVNRGYQEGEVVKLRVIEKLGSDQESIPPKFNNVVSMFKIELIKALEMNTIEEDDFVFSPMHVRTKIDLLAHLKEIYGEDRDFNIITKIVMNKILNGTLGESTEQIKDLVSAGKLTLAKMPENNVTELAELLSAEYFSVTFIDHDYAGITPKMWNYIAQYYGLDIKSTMAVTDPDDMPEILDVLVKDKRYIGGGLGVGFKDTGCEFLEQWEKGYVDPIALEMGATNFIAHFGNEIHGYNSDATGYVESLTTKLFEIGKDIEGSTIVLLGAGGTCRGIALEMINRGVKKLIILNRTQEKAQAIVEKLNKINPGVAGFGGEDDIVDIDYAVDAIVNLSTKGADGRFVEYSGMVSTGEDVSDNLAKSQEVMEKISSNSKDLIISDINLTKSKTTPMLDQARELGLNALDGTQMVVYQGVDAIWKVFGDKIIERGGSKEEVRELLIKLILK